MARIEPERVVRAAAAIAEADVGNRFTRSALEFLLVLKSLGISKDAPLAVTARQVADVCDRLFGVNGRPPYNWHDPITGKWGKYDPPTNWPTGTVWTQGINRPSLLLRKLISSTAVAQGKAEVILNRDYLEHLGATIRNPLPAVDFAVWFMRHRDDLESPVFADDLFNELATSLNLSEEEIVVLFGDRPGQVQLETTSASDAPMYGALIAKVDESPTPMTADPVPDEVFEDSYGWTAEYASVPLPNADVNSLVDKALELVGQADLVLPDEDGLIERCVVGLLTGHLILQGPPGTGKTTLARLLASAFGATVDLRTATADWTTYEVIGGLRPTAKNRLSPVLGCVPESVLGCAALLREISAGGDLSEQEYDPIARWLIIDELNRADIDRAIGGMYTVLSSTETAHLSRTPIDLWFEEGAKRQLWVPARFRLICTMNDVDTSFVNALSQGLTRRFQFVYVGVPGIDQQDVELNLSRKQALNWIHSQYRGAFDSDTISVDDFAKRTEGIGKIIQEMTTWLRYAEQDDKTILGWPLGTAQIVDLWKTVGLHIFSRSIISDDELTRSFDLSFADRIVPQMGTLRTAQLDAFSRYLRTNHPKLIETVRAVEHLANPQAVR